MYNSSRHDTDATQNSDKFSFPIELWPQEIRLQLFVARLELPQMPPFLSH